MAFYAAFRWRRLSATLSIGENTVADVCCTCQAKKVYIPLARGISKEQKIHVALGQTEFEIGLGRNRKHGVPNKIVERWMRK